MPFEPVISICKGILWSALILLGSSSRADQNDRVGGIGHILPEHGILDLVSPIGDVIDSVFVQEGDVVEKEARLVSLEARKAALLEVKKAELELKATREYGDQAVKILRLTIADFEYVVVQARLRQKRLEEAGGASFSEWQWEESKKALFQARNRLSRAQEEYKKERAAQDFSIQKAAQQLEAARERLRRTVVRATRPGTILVVHREPGESGGGVLISLADLSNMTVAADIFEGDLPKIRTGMKATIESSAFSTELTGRVISVDRQINARAQTGRVMIRLDQATPANRFIHMQVNVTIDTQP